jgi:hypothetical protein
MQPSFQVAGSDFTLLHAVSPLIKFRVGYDNPSQFSREYRRLFGAPPRRDVAAL